MDKRIIHPVNNFSKMNKFWCIRLSLARIYFIQLQNHFETMKGQPCPIRTLLMVQGERHF